MPEIYIDSLTIENFGPFYGETKLDFGTLEDRCGVLIGGKNGAGKTHLLRAIYLAVVGETGVYDLTNLEKSGSDATKFRFDQSLNRKAAAEGVDFSRLSIDISQRDERGGGAKKLTIERMITYRPNSSPRWESVAMKPDGTREVDDGIIQRLRDSWLPRHLARFFFFDAERSQGLHLGDRDITEGISRILGLWTYGELAEDLRNLINNKIPRVFNSKALVDEEKKLSDLSAEVLKTQGHIKSAHGKEQEINLRLNEIEKELAEIEEELRFLGAVDPEELEKRRERREEIKTSKDQLEAELRGAWETELPLALLSNYRHELHNYLKTEEKRSEWERSKATVEPKIPKVKSDVFNNVPSEYKLDRKIKDFYSDRLDQALRGIFNPPPEGMSERVFVIPRIDTSAQVRQRLIAGISNMQTLANLAADIEKKTAELRELDSWLRQSQQNMTSFTRCGELRERARGLQQEMDDLKREKGEVQAEYQQLEAKLGELKREEENQRKIVEKAEHGKTLSTLASQYRETVEEVQKRATIQLRDKISEQVSELWLDITERNREYIGMQFDKAWNCYLVCKDGKKVPWEETNTSAGQRQVRILAFYESLRRLARLVPPLVVDTPLGRLDKEVREAVLDNLYLSGHQSIILATNSEIDPRGSLYDEVKDKLARVYTLESHGKSESSYYTVSVRNDYFGNNL